MGRLITDNFTDMCGQLLRDPTADPRDPVRCFGQVVCLFGFGVWHACPINNGATCKHLDPRSLR